MVQSRFDTPAKIAAVILVGSLMIGCGDRDAADNSHIQMKSPTGDAAQRATLRAPTYNDENKSNRTESTPDDEPFIASDSTPVSTDLTQQRPKSSLPPVIKTVQVSVEAKYSGGVGDPSGLNLLRKTANEITSRVCERADLELTDVQPADMAVHVTLDVIMDMAGCGVASVTYSTSVDSPSATPVRDSRGSLSFSGTLRFTHKKRGAETELTGECELFDPAYMYESRMGSFEAISGESNLVPALCTHLARAGVEQRLTLLVDALRDPDSAVRKRVAQELQDLGWEPATDTDRAYLMMSLRRWSDCADLRELALEPLVLALGDPNCRIPLAAANALETIGAKAVEPLTVVAEDASRRAIPRITAVGILAELKDSRAVAANIRLLADHVPQVRSMAAWALGELGDPLAIEPLTKRLSQEEEADVVAQVREALKALEAVNNVDAISKSGLVQ